MTFDKIGRWVLLACVFFSLGACSVLDEMNIGGSSRTFDPTRVYLKDEFVTVTKRKDMDRYVCLSGPLLCEGFGQTWDCSCF